MDECITYIGLDVHKETIAVALAEGSGRGEVCAHGQISNTPAALSRLSVKLSRPGSVLRFCYEAGPCGYGIQRQLAAAGWTAPNEWSGLIVSASSASGPLERMFLVPAGGISASCAAGPYCSAGAIAQ